MKGFAASQIACVFATAKVRALVRNPACILLMPAIIGARQSRDCGCIEPLPQKPSEQTYGCVTPLKGTDPVKPTGMKRLVSTLVLSALALSTSASGAKAAVLSSPYGDANTVAVIATIFVANTMSVVPGVIWMRLSDNQCTVSAIPSDGQGLPTESSSVYLGGGNDTGFFVVDSSWYNITCGGYSFSYSRFNHNGHNVVLLGRAGNDDLTGSDSGLSLVSGGDGNDRLIARWGAPQNTLVAQGGNGDDYFYSPGYVGYLQGHAGNDLFCAAGGGFQVDGGDGTDSACGGVSQTVSVERFNVRYNTCAWSCPR